MSFVKSATVEALKSTMQHRHGAILFRGKRVLCTGHNSFNTGINHPTRHAEMAVLIKGFL